MKINVNLFLPFSAVTNFLVPHHTTDGSVFTRVPLRWINISSRVGEGVTVFKDVFGFSIFNR